MSDLMIGLLSFPALLTLIFLRVPIGFAMFATGLVGLILVTGETTIPFARLKSETYSTFSSYSLSIVPMFLLMGHFATLGGMSQSLFKAAESWLGHRKGGVAMAAVGACAGFGSICGSSLATAATMGQVALPELKRYGYPGGLATATLAAGGTAGILIPPSIVMVVYASATDVSVGRMFLAGVIPGLLAGTMLMLTIYVIAKVKNLPKGDWLGWGEVFASGRDAGWGLFLIVIILGGIYGGIFTPTEAAAVAAVYAFLISCFVYRAMGPLSKSDGERNLTVLDKPIALAERARRTPETPLTAVSMGKVTYCSTSSAESPPASVMMTTVGALSSGKTSTGILGRRYSARPTTSTPASRTKRP